MGVREGDKISLEVCRAEAVCGGGVSPGAAEGAEGGGGGGGGGEGVGAEVGGWWLWWLWWNRGGRAGGEDGGFKRRELVSNLRFYILLNLFIVFHALSLRLSGIGIGVQVLRRPRQGV